MHRFLRRIGLAAMAAIVLLPQAGEAADLPYLFQQLEKQTYKSSFSALFHNEKNLAPWLRAYLKARNGVDAPGQMVGTAEKPRELYAVCEPHNCAGNFIYVLFLPGGTKAWALFTKDGGNYRFFGHPDQQRRDTLTSAAKE